MPRRPSAPPRACRPSSRASSPRRGPRSPCALQRPCRPAPRLRPSATCCRWGRRQLPWPCPWLLPKDPSRSHLRLLSGTLALVECLGLGLVAVGLCLLTDGLELLGALGLLGLAGLDQPLLVEHLAEDLFAEANDLVEQASGVLRVNSGDSHCWCSPRGRDRWSASNFLDFLALLGLPDRSAV